jgi:hypothetical protein
MKSRARKNKTGSTVILAAITAILTIFPAGSQAQTQTGTYHWVSAATPPANVVIAPFGNTPVCGVFGVVAQLPRAIEMGLLVGSWANGKCNNGFTTASSAATVKPGGIFGLGLQFLVNVSGPPTWVPDSAMDGFTGDMGAIPANVVKMAYTDPSGGLHLNVGICSWGGVPSYAEWDAGGYHGLCRAPVPANYWPYDTNSNPTPSIPMVLVGKVI